MMRMGTAQDTPPHTHIPTVHLLTHITVFANLLLFLSKIYLVPKVCGLKEAEILFWLLFVCWLCSDTTWEVHFIPGKRSYFLLDYFSDSGESNLRSQRLGRHSLALWAEITKTEGA